MKDFGQHGWREISLGDICEKTETVDPRKAPEEEFDYVDVSSVSNETFTIRETQRLLGADAPSRARRQIRSGDILFATIRPTLQRIAQVPEYLDGQVCSTGYIVLRPKPDLGARFLMHALFRPDFMAAMETLQSGASYPAVTDKQVRSQKIPLPSLQEQQRIVAVLDEAFEGLARARAHAEANLQSARVFFDNALLAMMAEIDRDAPRLSLSAAAKDFGRGRSRHRPRNAPFLYGGPYPFIQTGDIRNASGRLRDFSQTYSEEGLSQSKLWPAGTVCITIAANIAETAVMCFEGCFPDSVIGMVPDDRVTFPEYVEYMLRFFATDLKAQGKGSAQDNINIGTFERTTFPFPSIE